MKSILERALVHLLNEENEKAEELLHQFVIEQARSIHETLRESDESDLEDQDGGEQFFTEADLADAETDGAVADLGDDLGEVPEVTDGGDLGDDSLDDGSADLGGDDLGDAPLADAGEGDVAAEMDDFEKELADLQAKFDSMVAQMDGTDDVSDTDGDMGDMGGEGDDLGDTQDFGGEGDDASGDGEAVEDGDDYDDITESIVDELQKITTPNVEGKGANGEQLQHNKASLITSSKGTASPQMSKQSQHKGFARETAPGTDPLKGGKTVSNPSVRNVRNSADTGNSKVSKEGDASATLNKAPATQDKSVISGKGKSK